MTDHDFGELANEIVRKLRYGGGAFEPGPVDDRRARDESRLRDEEARHLAESQARTLQAVLPPKMVELVTASPLSTPATEATIAWLDKREHRVLLLRGGIGVGKSAAAAIAVKASVERGLRSVSWHRPGDFVSAVLHAYDGKAPKLGRHLVVVDDLGRETKPEFAEALCTFIDDFDARCIITTNLTKDAFRERYDLRMIDRLNEVGTSATIKGESRRGKKGGF